MQVFFFAITTCAYLRNNGNDNDNDNGNGNDNDNDNDNGNSGGSSPTECKSISNGKTTYFGTVSDGFTASEVHKGAAKLVSLLGMAGSFVGPSIGKVVAECKADYTADLVEQLLPRCDDKCQPMKQCKSSCERLRSKCVPASLQGYFPMIKKGGSLRSMIGMVGLTEGSSDLKVIDAWVNKLEKVYFVLVKK